MNQITPNELKRLFPHASAGCLAANSPPVGAVETDSAKRAEIQALVHRVQKPAGGKTGVAVRVRCVTLRRRLLDAHDAVAYACKPLTDAIAERLGVDDADPRIDWKYDQLETRGAEGVIVMIERLP